MSDDVLDPNNLQIGGSHYKGQKVEHWDLIEQFGIGYLEGNASKYLFRWRKKGGITDLDKAGHYIDKLIHQVQKVGRKPQGTAFPHDVYDFCVSYGMSYHEFAIFDVLMRWTTVESLIDARVALQLLVESERKRLAAAPEVRPVESPGPGTPEDGGQHAAPEVRPEMPVLA